MNRKEITFWFFFFLLLSTVASAQQATKADIQMLESKISNLEITVREMGKRMTVQIQAVQNTMTEMDKRLSNQIVEMDKRLSNQIVESDKRLSNQIVGLDKRLSARIDMLFWAISALIGVVLAVIVLPQLLGYLQGRRERANLQKMIEELRQQIKQQQRDIEEIKSRKLVMPS